jgi:hypothetical protein
MKGAIAGFSIWFVVFSVLDWCLHKDSASMFSTMVSLIVALVVVLALGNKYPSLRTGAKGYALGMVVFLLAGFAVPFLVYPQFYGQFNPHFKIVDINYTSQYPTGYTYYARIRNDGIDGSRVVSCTVTRADLTTTSKSQTLYLLHGEEKSISFYFSATQVGTEWKEYAIHIES